MNAINSNKTLVAFKMSLAAPALLALQTHKDNLKAMKPRLESRLCNDTEDADSILAALLAIDSALQQAEEAIKAIHRA